MPKRLCCPLVPACGLSDPTQCAEKCFSLKTLSKVGVYLLRRVMKRENICRMCLKCYPDLFVSPLLLIAATIARLSGSVGHARHRVGRIGVVEHGHQTLVNCSSGLSSLLQQQKNHRIFDESRKYKENTDNKIEVNSIEARGYWSLFSKNNKIVITKRQLDPLFV